MGTRGLQRAIDLTTAARLAGIAGGGEELRLDGLHGGVHPADAISLGRGHAKAPDRTWGMRQRWKRPWRTYAVRGFLSGEVFQFFGEVMHAVQIWHTDGAAQVVDRQPGLGATQLPTSAGATCRGNATGPWRRGERGLGRLGSSERQQHDESESEYYEDPAEVSLYGCHNDRQTRTTQGRGRKTRGKLRSSTRAQQAAED